MVRLAIIGLLLGLCPTHALAQLDPAAWLRTHTDFERLELGPATPEQGFVRQPGWLQQADPYQEGTLKTAFELYIAPGRQTAPLVFVLTPYRGQTFADSGYAEALAKAGIHAAIIAVPKSAYQQDQGIDYVNRFFLRHTINVRALASALTQAPNSPIKISRLGLIGSSLGGIRASLVFGADPRFTAAVLIVPGGDLPNLIAHTILEPISRWREHFLNPQQSDEPFAEEPLEADPRELDAFEQQLRPHVQIDPLNFIRAHANRHLLWVRSYNDGFIPRINQDRLFNAYAKADTAPPREIAGSSLGHYATIISAYQSDRDAIIQFLKHQLLAP